MLKREGIPEARQEAAAQVEITGGNSTVIVPEHQWICFLLESVLFGIRHWGSLAGKYGNNEGKAHIQGKVDTEKLQITNVEHILQWLTQRRHSKNINFLSWFEV